MTRRTDRIGEQLRGDVARILREDVTDPRIRLVTITRVDVAPDLGNARVYWSSVGDREAIAHGLASAAGFVRGRLARVLHTKRVPELHFHFDASLEQGDQTLAVLRDVRVDEEDEAGDGPA